jgi:hypothetical protein
MPLGWIDEFQMPIISLSRIWAEIVVEASGEQIVVDE